LPIFSGNEPRPGEAFARLVERVLVKGNRAPRSVIRLQWSEDTGVASAKL